LYENAALREATESADTRPRSVMMSSVTPSLKYSCSGSPLMFTNGRMTTPGREGGAVSEAQEAGDAIAVPAWMSRGADWISTSRDTSATKPCHALSSGSPRQRERSAVWVSSKMIGR